MGDLGPQLEDRGHPTPTIKDQMKTPTITTILATLTVAATLALITATGTATAASYQVQSCAAVPIGSADDAWQPYGDAATITSFRKCPPKKWVKLQGLYLHDTTGAGLNASSGDERGWKLEAPPGTTITGLSYLRNIYKHSERWSPEMRTGPTGEGEVLDTCHIARGSAGCAVGNGGYPGREKNDYRKEVSGFATRSLHAVLRCDAPSGEQCINGIEEPEADFGIYSSTVTIEDPDPPTITNIQGELVDTARADHRGTETLHVEGRDETGLLAARVFIDGRLHAEQARNLDYSRVKPGTDDPFDLQVDTTGITDGDHQLEVALVDAARNEQREPAQQIHVRNRAATPPTNPVPGSAPVPLPRQPTPNPMLQPTPVLKAPPARVVKPAAINAPGGRQKPNPGKPKHSKPRSAKGKGAAVKKGKGSGKGKGKGKSKGGNRKKGGPKTKNPRGGRRYHRNHKPQARKARKNKASHNHKTRQRWGR